MKRFRMTWEGKVYEVTVEDPDANPVRVTVDGETFEIPLESLDAGQQVTVASHEVVRAGPSVPAAAPRPASVTGRVVKAPMPGTIHKVSVKPGDRVAQGQELLVLEAMKMKNVIRATAPGQVVKVNVLEKQSVQHGDVLIVFGD